MVPGFDYAGPEREKQAPGSAVAATTRPLGASSACGNALVSRQLERGKVSWLITFGEVETPSSFRKRVAPNPAFALKVLRLLLPLHLNERRMIGDVLTSLEDVRKSESLGTRRGARTWATRVDSTS